jgi:hypothetical protein
LPACRLVAPERRLSINAPLRYRACIADRHIRDSRRIENDREIFDKRYWTGETFGDHLSFALRHDEAPYRVMDTVEMPNRLAKDLVLLIRQNDGKLALRRRTKEFAALTDEEVVIIEQIIQEAFEGFEPE